MTLQNMALLFVLFVAVMLIRQLAYNDGYEDALRDLSHGVPKAEDLFKAIVMYEGEQRRKKKEE